MLIRLRLLITSTLLLIVASLSSQERNVEMLTVSDGLSQGYVPSIIQCNRGFIWFATGDGLDRYDGTEIKHYKNNINDPNSLIDNELSMMQSDAMGRIWIITQKSGLECFDPKTEIFHHLELDVEPSSIVSHPLLFKTAAGSLWISNFNTLIEIIGCDQPDLNKISFKNYIAGANMPNHAPFHYPLVSMAGELFVTLSNNKLKRFNAKKKIWEDFPPIKNIETNERSFVFNTIEDKLTWVYSNKRLQAWQGNMLVHDYPFVVNFDNAFSPHKNFIYKDLTGNLWMLLKGQLLKHEISALESGLNAPEVFIEEGFGERMFKDASDNLWVGTGGYGVRSLNAAQSKFEHWFANVSPMSFDKYKQGTYIINSTTLANEKGEILQETFDGRSVANAGVEYILDDMQDYRKLLIKKGVTEKVIDIPILNEAIPHLDKQNNYWIFFQNGELGIKWTANDTIEYHDYNVLWDAKTPLEVNSVFEGVGGILYLSTTKGLIQVNVNYSNRKLNFRKWESGGNNKLNTNAILCAMDDPNNPSKYLWVGTKGAGLNLMDKRTGNCTYYTIDEGLPNNVVYGILPDQIGHLWLSTNFGLSQFNLKNKQFRNFTAKNDGLQAEEFNTSAYFKLQDGRLAFGGVNGVSVFDPEDFIPDTSFSNVVFTSLKINNKEVSFGDTTNILQKPIDYTQRINLNHDQNFISLGIANIRRKHNENVSYYYKMDGIDKDWIFTNENNEHSYPNLIPGEYTFMVSDLNQAGERNPNSKKFLITIASPWWRTWIAYLVYASLFGGLLLSFLKFRLNRIKMQQDLKFKEKQTEQLKALDELKTRFFSNITHEFRTPLTLIKEPSRQLLKHSDSEVKQQSGVIFNNANKLLLLVNQLMDVSKLEDGKMKVNKFHGDILIVIRELFGYFKPLTDSKEQVLIWECDLPTLITQTDKEFIEKIIYNLLSNGHKFTPKGRAIKLKISTVGQQSWQIIVEDQGIGISQEDQSKIFDRFYQSDDSTTRKGEGTGIGLALVKELVDLLEGDIQVESQLGKGTTFRISFPLVVDQAVERISNVRNESSSLVKEILKPIAQTENIVRDHELIDDKETERILLVEDNTEMREYISTILLKNNYNVITAQNGEEGIAMAIENIPDLIISDVMMPIKDGFELLDAIKQNALTSHIPVVLLTAKVRLASKIEGYARKADAYLEKPFNTEELLARLKQLIALRKQLQLILRRSVINKNDKVLIKKLSSDDALELSKIDKVWIEDLQKTIKEKIGTEAFSVDALSVHLLMSRTQFFSKVKALTGLTPAVLVKNIRLDMAYQMVMDKPDLKFSEISNALGMSDSKYFKKLFKNRFGKSPQELSQNL